MGIKNAIVSRINKLCSEKNISYNGLATLSGVTPSTVYSLIDNSRKDIGIVVLKKLCDGFGITITEFFNDEIFKKLEQEIK